MVRRALALTVVMGAGCAGAPTDGGDDTDTDTDVADTDVDTDDTPTKPVETDPWDTDTDAADTDTDAVDTDTVDTDTVDTDTVDTDTVDSDSDSDSDTDTVVVVPGTCTGALVCDDFEGQTAGSAPSGGWRVITPDCSGSGSVVVDGAVAHSGSRSIRIDGAGGYCNHVFFQTVADIDSLGATIHGRFWVRFGSALTYDHVTFLAMDDVSGGRHLRMGGQSQILMWNRESDDATLPELSPTGIGLSLAPSTNTWHCVAVTIDEAQGTLATSVDGTPVAALQIDGTATPDVDRQWLAPGAWRPDLTSAQLGWESYGGAANTLWFDDVAWSSSPLPCP
ncbi:MAG: cellulose-binding protein [Alphaproteobacteria bacterium]|nr:cellulose-binding protein [Alphaproteobacteria bacterium]